MTEVDGINSASTEEYGPQPASAAYQLTRRTEPETSPLRILSRAASCLQNLLTQLVAQAKKVQVCKSRKRLKVCETVSLGEKRFVAVIQIDDQQFLLGGASGSVSLLAQLEQSTEFAKVLSARVAGVNI